MSIATLFVAAACILLTAIILVAVLNAYYQKAGRGIVLIRTGFGGQRVVIDGGCLILPFLHCAERMPTNGVTLVIHCKGMQSLMTADYIPLDISVEFVLRVDSSEAGIQTASRVVGAANLNSEDLSSTYQGQLIDAIQAEVSKQSLEQLHRDRDELGARIKARLESDFLSLGLLLESAALTYFDQSPPSTLSEEKVLDAQGMRTIAEQVSENRKRRAQIEADADAAIQATELLQTQRRVEHERQQKEAEIELAEMLRKIQAESEARSVATAEKAARTSEEAKLQREKDLREAELNRDLALRQREIEHLKEVEAAKIQSQIELANKRTEEIKAEAMMEESRLFAVHAQEKIQSERERLAAERRKEQALIRASEESEVNELRTGSETETALKKSQAKAKATLVESEALLTKVSDEAKALEAMIAAENNMDEKVVRMKLEQAKISILPEIASTLSKPLEKIEGIRINHVGGPGWPGSQSGVDASPYSEVMQTLLSMSMQLPVLKKIGEEIGLDIDTNAATRATDAITRFRQVEQRNNSSEEVANEASDAIGTEGDDGRDLP